MQQQKALTGVSVVLSGIFEAFEGVGIHQGKSEVRAARTVSSACSEE